MLNKLKTRKKLMFILVAGLIFPVLIIGLFLIMHFNQRDESVIDIEKKITEDKVHEEALTPEEEQNTEVNNENDISQENPEENNNTENESSDNKTETTTIKTTSVNNDPPPEDGSNPYGVDLDPANYAIVSDGENFTSKRSYYNKTSILLKNCTITLSAGDHAIFLSEVNNVTIANCIITGQYGGKNGIYIEDSSNVRVYNSKISQFSNGVYVTGQGSNILIAANEIHHTNKNGILSIQGDSSGEDISNLKILDNYLHNVAQIVNSPSAHGMYIQNKDFTITGNTVNYVNDSNGISVRSSGVVRNNTVSYVGSACISYYVDHPKGSSDTLYIENNILSNSGQRLSYKKLIVILGIPSGEETNTVNNIYIRNNNLTPNNDISVDSDFDSRNVVISENY